MKLFNGSTPQARRTFGCTIPLPPSSILPKRYVPTEVTARAAGAADVMVGNSSSGIMEAPSFGTPCVNIGRRQIGRPVFQVTRERRIGVELRGIGNFSDFSACAARHDPRHPLGDGARSMSRGLAKIDAISAHQSQLGNLDLDSSRIEPGVIRARLSGCEKNAKTSSSGRPAACGAGRRLGAGPGERRRQAQPPAKARRQRGLISATTTAPVTNRGAAASERLGDPLLPIDEGPVTVGGDPLDLAALR